MRLNIIEMITEAQAEHPGGSLSAADIATALYFRLMRIDPVNPQWEGRDRFILSKGHAWPVWYTALAERSYSQKTSYTHELSDDHRQTTGKIGWFLPMEKRANDLIYGLADRLNAS